MAAYDINVNRLKGGMRQAILDNRLFSEATLPDLKATPVLGSLDRCPTEGMGLIGVRELKRIQSKMTVFSAELERSNNG